MSREYLSAAPHKLLYLDYFLGFILLYWVDIAFCLVLINFNGLKKDLNDHNKEFQDCKLQSFYVIIFKEDFVGLVFVIDQKIFFVSKFNLMT